jgi:DNA polymerase-1
MVIDGDSLAHRAYHALPKTITGAGGRPINAIVGFANLLLWALEQEHPRAVLVAWDTLGVPTYRHELWPDYQAGRDFDDAILEQLDRLPELVSAFGFRNAKEAGYEADDFLAAAARREEDAGGKALVVTSDRDAYQLVSERVTVLAPARAGQPWARVGPAEVRRRYGVSPHQVPDFIALRGDPSDRMPGARGVGPKTAADLLARHGSLEALAEAVAALPEGQATNLRDPRLLDFKRVATMDVDAPVELPPDAGLDASAGADYAERVGAARLAERLRAMVPA